MKTMKKIKMRKSDLSVFTKKSYFVVLSSKVTNSGWALLYGEFFYLLERFTLCYTKSRALSFGTCLVYQSPNSFA